MTRIAGLLALAIGLASAGPGPLVLATVLLALLAGREELTRTVFLDSLHRLRWLIGSIALLYAFLLPGEPLVPGWEEAAPSRQGLVEGLLRGWMLWMMAGAARCLMATTGREALMGALYWFTRPLEYLGLDVARFSLRLVLTLEYALLLHSEASTPAEPDRSATYTQRAAQLARSRLRRAEAAAEASEPGPVSIPLVGAPPWWQWCVPAALLIALLALERLA